MAFLSQNRYHRSMLRTLLKRFFTRRRSVVERHPVAIIVACAIGAMLLSLSIGIRQSVWFDEAYSILLAKQSWEQLLYLTSIDTHPPLYYLLLKVWATIFGWGELALRSLSILAFGGSVFMGGLLVRRLFGIRIALIAVVLMVLSPFMLRYGFEIRMYALGSLIGVAATYVLIVAQQARVTAERIRYYVLYALLVALGMYTLYYMALLWIAHLVWLIWMEWRRSRSVARLARAPWLFAYAGAVTLFLPWLPTFLKQFGNGALAPIAEAVTLENMISIVSFLTVYEPLERLGPTLSLIVAAAILTIGWLAVRAFRFVTAKERPYLVLLAMYLLVPIAVLAVVGFVRPMFVERYLSHVAIGATLFLSVAIGIVWSRAKHLGRWAIGGLAAVFLIGVLQLTVLGNYNFQRSNQPAAQQIAALVQDCHDGVTVLAGDPYVAIELLYYLDACPVYFYDPSDYLIGGYAPLNESDLQVKDPVSELPVDRPIHYVYFDQAAVDFSANRSLLDRRAFGPVSLDTFNAVRND